jgi:lactate permease
LTQDTNPDLLHLWLARRWACEGSSTRSASLVESRLFGNLQVTAAAQLHANPALFASAGSSGGVMAKMISPQNLAIGTAGVRKVGMEGVLFRNVFGWSVLFLLGMCVLAFLQSTPVLGWMCVGG